MVAEARKETRKEVEWSGGERSRMEKRHEVHTYVRKWGGGEGEQQRSMWEGEQWYKEKAVKQRN